MDNLKLETNTPAECSNLLSLKVLLQRLLVLQLCSNSVIVISPSRKGNPNGKIPNFRINWITKSWILNSFLLFEFEFPSVFLITFPLIKITSRSVAHLAKDCSYMFNKRNSCLVVGLFLFVCMGVFCFVLWGVFWWFFWFFFERPIYTSLSEKLQHELNMIIGSRGSMWKG